MNKKITDKHIKDVYQKFKDFYIKNESSFFDITQKHIVEEIKKIIYAEGTFEWNEASLTDYINNLVYMIKGEQFARTINKFAEQYFIENICNDFDDTLCENAKNSLEQHKIYNKNITSKNDDISENNITNKSILKNAKLMNIKNIILYGAPGVGKTHNYQNVISMIEEGKSQKEIFDTVSKNSHTEQNSEIFKTIKDEKRVEFVTFHQSYSYEDFIEGFRPNESGKIELEDGIFKRHALNASNKIKESEFQHISFDEAYDILRTAYINEELETLKTVTNADIIINDFKEKSLSVQTVNAKDPQYVKKHDLETVVNAMLKNLVNKPSDIRRLEVKKDTFSLSGYYFPIGNKIVEIIKNNKIDVQKEKNFYIVIDEINRGNISKIFGELITLIEEDKRDVYEVTLPYSKEKFKVPSNFYIIATMNSTDKSIATIDIALRRRFTFLKMKPNVELIKFDNARLLFTKLNEFIEKNINEDFKLGHSYFMKIKSDEDLEFVKEYKIKPLLEEYFYADKENYDKAVAILNKESSND